MLSPTISSHPLLLLLQLSEPPEGSTTLLPPSASSRVCWRYYYYFFSSPRHSMHLYIRPHATQAFLVKLPQCHFGLLLIEFSIGYRRQGQGREQGPIRPIPERAQESPGRAWCPLEGGLVSRGEIKIDIVLMKLNIKSPKPENRVGRKQQKRVTPLVRLLSFCKRKKKELPFVCFPPSRVEMQVMYSLLKHVVSCVRSKGSSARKRVASQWRRGRKQ